MKRTSMNIAGIIFSLIVFFTNLSLFGQQFKLDLTKPDQQKDFLQYLKLTTSVLEDNNIKSIIKGYEPQNLTDSNKQEIAKKILKDTVYFKKLNNYFVFLKIMNYKYEISKFTHEEWKEVAQFGAQHGIYFIQAMKKLKAPKDTLSGTPNFFPFIPVVKDSSKIN